MLAILETLSPIEEYLELFEKALTAIEFRLPFTIIVKENGKPDWKKCRDKLMDESIPDGDDENRGLSTAQITSVFDALPFLFDTVACYEQLEKFQDTLSMLVMIALTGNAVVSLCSQNIENDDAKSYGEVRRIRLDRGISMMK